MNELDFYTKIESEDIFDHETFDLTDQTININKFKSEWVTFINCTFNCRNLNFKNIKFKELRMEFYNCSFNCNVNFSNCTFDSLTFKNTGILKSLNIGNSLSKLTLNFFEFSNDSEIKKPELTTDFNIRNTNIENFNFENIKHIKGIFQFLGNTLGDTKGSISFQNTTISNFLFGSNSFLSFSSFKKMTFESTFEFRKPANSAFKFPGFYKNRFVKVSFSESNFLNTVQFENCDFLSTTWFEKCKNVTNSHLIFVACEFKGFSLFNKSKINFLDIDRCTFDKSSSFADAEFNTLKLFEVKFAGGAYFDDMKINKVLNKSYLKDKSTIAEWKKTLRAIKQESQKTENRIDFNNYRNYELEAHYKELSIKENFKDTSILWATKWSSNFGSWTWAFWFTIISGVVWYSILYRFENIGEYNRDQVESYFISLFRFFLITDFYSPFEIGRNYLTNIESWIPFIFGKIFIAFGIYEMVQSFRKFKA